MLEDERPSPRPRVAAASSIREEPHRLFRCAGIMPHGNRSLTQYFADDADQHAQHVHAVAVDRLHRLVGGLEANSIPITIDLLERRFAVFVTHGNDLTVARLLLPLDDHEVAVGDVLVDHRVSRRP